LERTVYALLVGENAPILCENAATAAWPKAGEMGFREQIIHGGSICRYSLTLTTETRNGCLSTNRSRHPTNSIGGFVVQYLFRVHFM